MRIPFLSTWLENRAMRDAALAALIHANTHTHEKLNYTTEKLDEHNDALTALLTKADELLKLNRRRELMVAAAENLVEKLADKELAEGAANAFSATELFPIVDLLRTAGRPKAAEWWAEAHDDWADFMSDDEPEDQDQTELVNA